MSRIIQLIDDIEDFFEQCNSLPFTNKVVVDKDDVYELMTELRLKVPDEIKKSARVIEEKEKIMNEAKQFAEEMEKQAETKISSLVNEHEIIQQAYEKAQVIIDKAKEDAREMRLSAISYVDEILEKLEKAAEYTLNNAKTNYETLLNNLTDDINLVKENRKELNSNNSSYENEEE
ncbi:hypothetical protein EDC18_101256 [Natranaerovirga pectinivora]|uniref:ATPase n=1 Tax=Natranaerovirga pectinivora TaxID=682400 RepID=A0A4R3MTC2_9FIRM|nr:vacuolar family H+-ATPase subunit H [Natranaerovirga pectinivora]TCT16960.1 hypothetical protein EDC18_101256 [Natranaerovirga pectinivora]